MKILSKRSRRAWNFETPIRSFYWPFLIDGFDVYILKNQNLISKNIFWKFWFFQTHTFIIDWKIEHKLFWSLCLKNLNHCIFHHSKNSVELSHFCSFYFLSRLGMDGEKNPFVFPTGLNLLDKDTKTIVSKISRCVKNKLAQNVQKKPSFLKLVLKWDQLFCKKINANFPMFWLRKYIFLKDSTILSNLKLSTKKNWISSCPIPKRLLRSVTVFIISF